MSRHYHLKLLLAICGGFLAWAQTAPATPVISEFMASNKTVLADDDGSFSDWLEIYNPDDTTQDLTGWYLTDSAKKPTKWQFPAVSLEPHGYLVVFASSKDRRDPAKPLHTNFDLSAGGEYLGLIQPDGVTIASEYAPTFPAQVTDISYGITQPDSVTEAPQRGFFAVATPGAANGGAAALSLPVNVSFSRAAGTFTGTVAVELTGAGANQHIRYELVAPSSAGPAAVGPTAASTLYTGPIALSASMVVRASVFTADDTQHGPIAVAHYLQLATTGDASLANFSSALPLLVLDDHGAGDIPNDDQDHAAWLHVFTPGTTADSGTVLTGSPTLALPVAASLRGSSSANFPKKSYNFDLLDAAGRDNPQPLLGLASAKDWALVSPWYYDRAYVRNAYVYALGTSLGRWAPKIKFVELFVNTGGDALDQADYAGISLLTERIKISPTRVNLTSLSSSDLTAPDVTGGYILKIDDPGSNNLTWSTTRGFPSYPGAVLNVDSPKADKLAPAQATYIKGYVQDMENALFADHASGWATRRYLDYIDRPSWVDYHLINILVANVDAFQRSVYFTKDRGGKLVAGPLWDYDRSLGSADGRDLAWDTWKPLDVPDPWNFEWWGELAHDPDFMQAWVDRWQTLRRNQLADSALTGLADTLATQVTPAAAARDAARWVDNQSQYPGGFTGEITHIKDWITHRAAWIDQRFVAQPTAEFNGQKLIVTPPSGAQLAYTLDGSDPRTSGGQLSTNATLSSEALVVDLDANPNLRVRAYDVRYADIFPSSPWSSSAKIAELPKASRLVNLSSRGFIGNAEAVMLSGVVVSGPSTKRFLVRAVGPGLANFGVSGALPDPVLRMVAGDGTILATNTVWGSSTDAAQLSTLGSSVGAFPLAQGSADSALVIELPPGSYTAVMSSASGQTGVGLIELYELDSTASRAINLSTRAYVEPGEKILIGGLVISGFAPKRVLLRAVGPALGAFGLTGALVNPQLTVFDSNQAIVGENDDWGSGATSPDVAAAITAAGAFTLPDGSKDAALVLTLNPGNYTLQMSGKDGGGGVALVEVYELSNK